MDEEEDLFQDSDENESGEDLCTDSSWGADSLGDVSDGSANKDEENKIKEFPEHSGMYDEENSLKFEEEEAEAYRK